MKNIKIVFVVYIVLIFILNGCAHYYKFSKFCDGYTVEKEGRFFPELTEDDTGKYPKDLALAKKRFSRRKKTVEDWYKKYRPDDLRNPSMELLKAIIALPLIPIIIPMWIIEEHRFHSHELTEEERKDLEAANKRYKEALNELEAFIVNDCKSEKLTN